MKVQKFEAPNTTVPQLDEDGFFTFIDNDGRLTNGRHFLSYLVLGVFLITSVLCCVFSDQIKICCALCCKRKRFVPSVHYDVSEDDVTVVNGQEPANKMVTVTLGDMFENHSADELLTTSLSKAKESRRVQYQMEMLG